MVLILPLIMLSLLSVVRVGAWKEARLGARPSLRMFTQSLGHDANEKISTPIDISGNEMLPLGLSTESVQALQVQGITKPTSVQKTVIPRLLNRESLVMAAATGSGKTLAFILPAIEHLHNEELLGYVRRERRPRVLVLVPTRDLARQVLGCIKSVGHYSKVSSAAVFGGEQYAIQKKNVSLCFRCNLSYACVHDMCMLCVCYVYVAMVSSDMVYIRTFQAPFSNNNHPYLPSSWTA